MENKKYYFRWDIEFNFFSKNYSSGKARLYINGDFHAVILFSDRYVNYVHHFESKLAHSMKDEINESLKRAIPMERINKTCRSIGISMNALVENERKLSSYLYDVVGLNFKVESTYSGGILLYLDEGECKKYGKWINSPTAVNINDVHSFYFDNPNLTLLDYLKHFEKNNFEFTKSMKEPKDFYKYK